MRRTWRNKKGRNVSQWFYAFRCDNQGFARLPPVNLLHFASDSQSKVCCERCEVLKQRS